MPSNFNPYIFDNKVFQQTSDATPVVPAYYFFSIGADNLPNLPGVYLGVTALYPGPDSPQTISHFISPTRVDFGSPAFDSLANLHTHYSFGDYSIATFGNGPALSGSISYQADYFANTIPTVSNFKSLSTFDTTHDFTVQLNSFTPDPHVTTGLKFFSITDATTHQVVFDSGALSSSSPGVVIPANKLAPDKVYTYELDFSDRLDVAGTTQGFDERTDGTFTTSFGSLQQEFLWADQLAFADNPGLPRTHLLTHLPLPVGWQLEAGGSAINTADGFFAEAFDDGKGHTIISFAGSVIGPNLDYNSPWAHQSRIADLDVIKADSAQHTVVKAFDDAFQFTEAVLKNHDPSTVYVTGHSLGGAEAEYVDAHISSLAGGASFGGPGIYAGTDSPQSSNVNSNFTDYIDFGDPVANYGRHYGHLEYTGQDSPATRLDIARTEAVANGLAPIFHSNNLDLFLKDVQLALFNRYGLDAPSVGQDLVTNHPLNHYAADLHLFPLVA